jgi:MarR family transcriptional regulator for hemolysin
MTAPPADAPPAEAASAETYRAAAPSADALRGSLAMLIGQASRQWRRAVDRRLQPFGLSEATWRPLLHISRATSPMRQKDLAQALSLDHSSVVRTLDALQAAGFIERREADQDRRAKAILLTTPGRAIVGQVEAVSRQVSDETLAGLTGPEIEAARRVLDRICRTLAESLEDAP